MSTYTVMPAPYLTLFNNSGVIINGGLIWTYLAGTTTPTATYTDATGNTQNTNPIVADSAGRFVAFLAPNISYKFVFETAATPPAHGTVLKTVDAVLPVPATGGTSDTATSVNNFRLTLSSGGLPVMDVLAATTLYLTPYTGTQLALFDALGIATVVSSGQISIAIPATTNTNYDVFCYLSSGLPVLELNPWRNSGQAITGATNATPIVITANSHGLLNGDQVYINGLPTNQAANGTWTVANKSANTFELGGSTGSGSYTAATGWLNARQSTGLLSRATVGTVTKSGDLTRRYLGSFRTTGVSGQSEDSNAKRLLWNNDNRVQTFLRTIPAVSSYTIPSNTIRQANADTANQVEVVVGIQGQVLQLTARFLASNQTSAISVVNGIGEDSTTQYSLNCDVGSLTNTAATGSTTFIVPTTIRVQTISGYHVYSFNESAPVVGSNNIILDVFGQIYGTLG